jgi:uncharacterized protein YcfJ
MGYVRLRTDTAPLAGHSGDPRYKETPTMNATLRNALALAGLTIATQAAAQITFYENDGFTGRSFSTGKQVTNFEQSGFNDRASSVIVLRDRWEVCENAGFAGRCIVLRPGRYEALGTMGLNDRISSVRMVSVNTRVDDNRYAPPAVPVYDNRRRGNERLYEANVTSVRAVMGPAEQRCWVEREQVTQDSGKPNVGGAIIGGIIGGVLGHQVGGGRGQDVATAGGAVAGALVGSKVGRDNTVQQGYGQNVQRCASAPNQGPPQYWDVTYNFKGRDHRIQMASQPGATVSVNAQGEPRA